MIKKSGLQSLDHPLNRLLQGVIATDDDLMTARALYRQTAASNPDRLLLLCDRARLLAKSDRPEITP